MRLPRASRLADEDRDPVCLFTCCSCVAFSTLCNKSVIGTHIPEFREPLEQTIRPEEEITAGQSEAQVTRGTCDQQLKWQQPCGTSPRPAGSGAGSRETVRMELLSRTASWCWSTAWGGDRPPPTSGVQKRSVSGELNGFPFQQMAHI